MNTIVLVLLFAFGFAADYTVQNNHIPKLDLEPHWVKPYVEPIPYHRIEYLGPDMYLPVPDTIYMLNENDEIRKR